MHVSRLLVLHLDNDKWKCFILHTSSPSWDVIMCKLRNCSYALTIVSCIWVGIKSGQNLAGVICPSGIEITWVQVSRLPMPHPDNDR